MLEGEADGLLYVCEGQRCTGHVGPVGLAVKVGGRVLGGSCWRKAGRLMPDVTKLKPAHELEEETRKRMQARKGTDLHMVRNGRT